MEEFCRGLLLEDPPPHRVLFDPLAARVVFLDGQGRPQPGDGQLQLEDEVLAFRGVSIFHLRA